MKDFNMTDETKNENKVDNSVETEHRLDAQQVNDTGERGYFLFAYEYEADLNPGNEQDTEGASVVCFTHNKEGATLDEIEEVIQTELNIYPLNSFFIIKGIRHKLTFNLVK